MAWPAWPAWRPVAKRRSPLCFPCRFQYASCGFQSSSRPVPLGLQASQAVSPAVAWLHSINGDKRPHIDRMLFDLGSMLVRGFHVKILYWRKCVLSTASFPAVTLHVGGGPVVSGDRPLNAPRRTARTVRSAACTVSVLAEPEVAVLSAPVRVHFGIRCLLCAVAGLGACSARLGSARGLGGSGGFPGTAIIRGKRRAAARVVSTPCGFK